MQKISFVFLIVCILLLSSCLTLLENTVGSAGGTIGETIGDVVVQAGTAAVQTVAQNIQQTQARIAHDRVVTFASNELLRLFPPGTSVWIHNSATGSEAANASGIVDDLTSILLQNGIVPVDRQSIQLVEAEQMIQLSGGVRDEDIMNIGNQIGARYLTTINIIVSNPGNVRRLQMRVLDIETNALLMQSDTSNNWLL